MKSILDPTFKYTPSVSTDIAKTFARIRRAQRLAVGEASASSVERSPNVTAFDRRVRANGKGA